MTVDARPEPHPSPLHRPPDPLDRVGIGRPRGKGDGKSVPENAGNVGYYGHPFLKPPVWTWEIPLYFFVGGISGTTSIIAFAVLLLGVLAPTHPVVIADGFVGASMATTALWVAMVALLASLALLIADLGRPGRFHHMLRVLKWQSPMSVGVWVLSLFGPPLFIALVLRMIAVTVAPELFALQLAILVFSGAAALLGSVVCTYTGVLIAVTAVPAWFLHRALLPIHFGIAALGSGVGVLVLCGFASFPLLVLLVVAAAGETMVGVWLELARHGAADKAAHEGASGWSLRMAELLSGPVALIFLFTGWPLVAASSFLLGALVSRYAWMSAGRRSATDPQAVLAVKPHLARRPAPQRSAAVPATPRV